MGAPDLAAQLPFLWSASSGELAVSLESSAPFPDTVPRHFGIKGNEYLQEPLVVERVFDAAECARIRELAAAFPLYNGKSAGEKDYRICTINFVPEAEETGFIFERVRQLVLSLNRRYRFQLEGFTEPFHFITYKPGGHFGWHCDLAGGQVSTRKLSISVQLSDPSDYVGGDLEMCPHGTIAEFRGLGNALAFPSYIPHRVGPVTAGLRQALVIWVHGTAFS